MFKDINHANGAVFSNVIIEPFREQRTLASVFAYNETLHWNLELLRQR